ncbi:MAG: hypothetical protein Q8Q41_03495 [bacterium]|nr:hypothetical protein [bacterium]
MTNPLETPYRPETETQFEAVIRKGIDEALVEVRRQFEDTPEKKDRLPFHNTRHTKDVVRRTGLIFSAIREARPELVSERDIALGRLTAAYHDIIQRWEENRARDGEFEKTMRRRFTTQNEYESAERAVQFMDCLDAAQDPLFTEEDKMIVREAIDVTIPGFSPEKGTVIQPNLKETSSLITRAIALADLGTAGMDGARAYAEEGDALFREENLDILEAAKDPGRLPEAQKQYYAKRMIGWSKFQATFARGREALLENELTGLDEASKNAAKKLFNKFSDTILRAEEKGKQRESMSFEELLADMGYETRKASET